MFLNFWFMNAMEEFSDTGAGSGATTTDSVESLIGLTDSSTTDTSTEDTSTEGTEDTSTEGTESQQSGDKTEKSESKIDWKTVPSEVKGHIQEISKTNPKLGNLLQNAVYTSQSMLREFPGGLKEVKALKASVDEIGGIEEAKVLRDTHRQVVEDQEDLDNKAREGNPEVLGNLISVAGNEGFSKLMPSAIDKWAALDAPGYTHVMSKVVVNALREGGVVSELNMAFRLLNLKTPEATSEALQSLTKVADWANGINKTAQTAPERPKVDPKIQDQQRSIDDQKAQLFNQKFSGEFGSWRNGQINDNIKTVSNGRQLSDYQRNTLGQKIVQEIQDILTADPEYMKNLQKIYSTRDMAELHKFTRSRTSKLLPEATRKAYKSLFSDPVKKVTNNKKPDSTKVDATQTAAPVKGWQKVSADKAPTPDQIDSKKTTFEMKFRQQAILKNGTKVYWGNRVPA